METRIAEAAKSLEARLPDWKLAYRIDEAAAATGYGKSKLWELIRLGRLRAKKDGGVTIIRRGDLQSYLDGLPDREARS